MRWKPTLLASPHPWLLALALPLALATSAAAEDVIGRVVDEHGKAVADIDVSSFWQFNDGDINAYNGATTDADGSFTVNVNFYGRPGAILAMNADRTVGGIIAIDPNEKTDEPVTITLEPLVEVKGEFTSEGLGQRPAWTNVYMNVMPGRIRIASSMSQEATFRFMLPAGDYQFYGYGTDVKRLVKNMTLTPEERIVDMGEVDLAPTIIAQHYGKEPPDWYVTDARDVDRDVTIADYMGKWLLIEFWGFW